MEGLATLHISRDRSRWTDRWRSYRVVLDGTEVARLRNGEEERLPISAGSHALRLKLDWVGSRMDNFEAVKGEQVSYVCRAGVNPMLALFGFIRATVRRDTWIILERRA